MSKPASAPTAFLEQAIQLASRQVREGQGGPFGALVVRDGIVVAQGVNSVTRLGDPTAHAEVMAIREACKKLGVYQLDGCEIYSSCEPCPMCLGAIYWARPRALIFAARAEDAAQAGFDDRLIYEEIRAALPDRRIPTTRLELANALEPFRLWNESSRKILY